MSQARLVGLDTSVVLRLLLGEPIAQAERAVAELNKMRGRGKRGAVSDLVISEAYFALQYHYDVPKQLALDKLREFLESPEIVPLGEALAILQQEHLAKAKPGFVDRMIHADYLRKTSTMVTFEKASAKLSSVLIP